MNFQLQYYAVHEFLCTCYEYIQKMGEEFPAMYALCMFGY